MSEKWLVRRLIGLNRVKNWISEHNEKLHSIKTKELEGVVSDKTREVEEKTEKIGFLSGELEKSNNLVELLRKGSGEKDSRIEWLSRELEKTNTKLKETEDLLCLSNKPLPPLPEKKSEFQQLKTKVKSKFNH